MAVFWFAVMFLGGIGCTSYLVVQGHPWFALLNIIVTSGLRMRVVAKDKPPASP